MFTFELHGTEEFVEYLQTAKSKFAHMIDTMEEVATMVHRQADEIVPLDTGRLKESFRYYILADNSQFKVIMMGYRAYDPYDGYDYSYYQHEEPLYHTPPRQWKYLETAMTMVEDEAFTLIEQDYLSLFNGVVEV